MPSEGIGRWEISIGEHGIRMKRGLAFTEYSWEDYNCLAETEDTFYFVNSGAGRGICVSRFPSGCLRTMGKWMHFSISAVTGGEVGWIG